MVLSDSKISNQMSSEVSIQVELKQSIDNFYVDALISCFIECCYDSVMVLQDRKPTVMTNILRQGYSDIELNTMEIRVSQYVK